MHVAYVAGLPARVPDHVARVDHLQHGEVVDVGVHRGGEAPARARSPGATARHVSKAVTARAMAASVCPRVRLSIVVITSPVAGLRMSTA